MRIPTWAESKPALQRLYTKIFSTDVLGNSAQVAFYFSFALFPLLFFLVSLFGIILVNAEDLKGELFTYLAQIMPPSAFELVKSTLEEVIQNSSGGKLTLGLVVTLWSASAGVDSLRQALNEVYQLAEDRAWWHTKLQSLIMTFLFVALLTIALGIVFYGGQILNPILNSIGLSGASSGVTVAIQWIALLVVMIISTAVVYSWLPSFPELKWVWISPGAVVAIILFILLTGGFRLYLHYFNTYNKTYGSLGAVIILMLWLYLTAVALLVGGAINSVLNELTPSRKQEHHVH
jgi:membrane protein